MFPRWGFHVLWMEVVHTLTAYFGHHGPVGRQLTATLAHHHSTICYKYDMILYVIYVPWMLEVNSILLYSLLTNVTWPNKEAVWGYQIYA